MQTTSATNKFFSALRTPIGFYFSKGVATNPKEIADWEKEEKRGVLQKLSLSSSIGIIGISIGTVGWLIGRIKDSNGSVTKPRICENFKQP